MKEARYTQYVVMLVSGWLNFVAAKVSSQTFSLACVYFLVLKFLQSYSFFFFYIILYIEAITKILKRMLRKSIL